MKLRWKIQLALLSIALLPFLTVGLIGYTQSKRTLQDRFLHHLESVAALQERSVEAIFARNLERLRLVSSRSQLQTSLATLAGAPAAAEREKIARLIANARDSVEQIRQITIYDAAGNLVASTDPDRRTDENAVGEDFFEKALNSGDRVESLEASADGHLAVVLTGSLDLDGRKIGVIVLELSGDELLAIAATDKGLGETGETLLAVRAPDGSARYLTPGRFASLGSSLMSAIPSDTDAPIYAALDQREAVFTNEIDYRGQHVLAVTRFVETANLGIEVKADRAEAFAPARQLGLLTGLNMLVALILVVFVSLALTKTILRPVEDLTKSAHVIESGNYDHRVEVRGTDEISDLADAFNLMAQQLTVANRTLEEKVKRRTRQLQTTKERFELAVQGSAAGIWDWDLSKKEVYFSDRFKELLGFRPLDFESTFDAWEKRIHPDDRQEFVADLRRHLDGDHDAEASGNGERLFDRDCRLQLRDGSFRWFHARGTAFRVGDKGKPTRMSGSINDIHERREYEQKLEHSVRELEQFAYVASHDLREPLRMVASYVKLLERRYAGQLDDDARTFIHYAVDGANRMQTLIEDLLDYSRVGAGPAELEPIHAEQALADATQNLQEAIKESAAKITHDPLPIVSADQTQLTRVFQNLLANAIKFRADKTPEIHISVAPEHGQWKFSVKDNGIGIKEDYQARIFKIFKRLHSRDDYEGTGIGLAVVQKIVQRHGGQIWIKSAEGEGATFYFTLNRPM